MQPPGDGPEQPEEFEHIPWADLVAEQQAGRNRVAYVVAAVLVALTVGAVGARALSGSRPSRSAEETVPVENPTRVTEAPPASVPDAPLLSEADLMAAVPVEGSEAARTRAEWFVTDYFTADLDPQGSAEINDALPAGSRPPSLQQDRGGPTVSYVEWARAFESEVLGPNLYRVGVAFRAIGAPENGGFIRLPVRAVDVVVVVTESGGTAVADLPAPRPLPEASIESRWPDSGATVPESILQAARDSAAIWGDDPRVVDASGSDGEWRVVISVQDPVGNRWPLSLWLDDEGTIFLPLWLADTAAGDEAAAFG